MKKILFIFFLLIAILLGTAYFFALPKAEKALTTTLQDIGFSTVDISRIKITPTGFVIPKVKLDEEGFSYIENLNAELFWPTYITKGEIDFVTVDKLIISTITESPKDILLFEHKMDFSGLAKTSIANLKVDNLVWDTKTPQGALRFTGMAVMTSNDGSGKLVKAMLATNQHQLSFDSQWSGTLSPQGDIDIQANISALRVNYGPVSISRGNGWMAYAHIGEDIKISGQIEAGRGEIFNVPANNINLLIGEGDGYVPVLFRATASGIDDVRLMTDLHWSKTETKEAFSSVLEIGNLSNFLGYLKEKNLIDNIDTQKYQDFDNADIIFTYMADKRFADGPLPFEAKIKDDSGDTLEGTFLIYPETLDIRGTAKTDERYLSLIKNLLSLSEDHIIDDTIRLDGNLYSLIPDNQGYEQES